MPCPSATFTVWSAAWLHQRAASDNVLDALRFWAERHDVVTADQTSADALDLPRDGETPVPPAQLLTGLRGRNPRYATLVLPAAGDVRGLGGPGPFARATLAAGEAAVFAEQAIGLVPHEPADGVLRWTAHALPSSDPPPHEGIGEAERDLSEAVQDSAAILTGLEAPQQRPEAHSAMDARLRTKPAAPWPDGMPARSLRVLHRADEVETILTLADSDDPGAALSASTAQRRSDALRPLAAAVRNARCAAVAEAVQELRGCAQQQR